MARSSYASIAVLFWLNLPMLQCSSAVHASNNTLEVKDRTMVFTRALEILLVGAVIIGFGMASAGLII